MKKTSFLRNTLVGFALLTLANSSVLAMNPPHKPGLTATANKFIGNALSATATGTALAGLAYGGYQAITGIACWAKSYCVSGEDQQNPFMSKHDALIKKRDERFIKSLASFCVAGAAYGLTQVNSSHLILHFDLGKFIEFIIKALSSR